MSSHVTRGAGSPVQRPAPHKWYFTKEEMRDTASIKEGMSREEEMNFRQLAAAFIQEMIDGLNNVKDPKMRIGHTAVCSALTHMHRFYYWHSFKKFDYRDVGAACVFLAGKSQECPRKLSHVIQVWRDKKERKQLTTEAARAEAAQIIVLLESMILQTIAFDLNIELPHVKVLEILRAVDKENRYIALANCAFYFATDVIAVTDWSLRYSAASMSIAIIHLMAAYANVKIDRLFSTKRDDSSGEPWFARFDTTMTDEKLKEMEMDFLTTYRTTCRFHYASKYIPDYNSRHPPKEIPDVEMARKMDRGRSNSPMVHHLPDSTQNGRPRGYVPKDELTVERLNKERQHEEERRKRDHDRMSGRIDNSSSSEKRARIDPLSNNFVSSSSSSQPTHSMRNSTKNSLHPPPIPPVLAPPTPSSNHHSTSTHSSGNSKNHPINKRTNLPSNPSSSSSSPAFRNSARAFDVPPILTPPVQPKMASADNSDMDLEDGELE